ncbi:ATP-binding cassette domain-containing protein [Nocardiopsis alba]|uniref:ATP-binding cassette domain-containing protein n=1 Tax=Nocardiopsis alba TaxID=53437 RepID=A0A7K2J094_9ACTN|nr:ABC transporter ATP-binding protein [Nocardiopsis alba]MYR35641.1 ATP-binding cassette domain-containing protein [Nocardiopsis alba]
MASHTGRLTLTPPTEGAPLTTEAPAVRVRGLTRGFDGRAVLRGVDLDIARGEFVALLGRSGSGKSTLLRAVAGLDHGVAGAGDVDTPESVSMVFQDSRLLPWQRVLANVTLALPGPGARERGRAALAEVGLEGRERAWPHELSGGELQRAALARSLVREPRLLLADEPFGALDALTRTRMQDLLLRLTERHRPAVLLVTHSVDEAIVLADRVVVLSEGVVAADLRVDLVAPREVADPGFAALRARLLSLLGVDREERATGE